MRRIFRRRRTRRYVTSQDANRPKYAPCRRSCLDGPGLRLDVGGRSALLVGATRFNGQRPTSVARGYQSNSSFEPSVAAVIIAGMPIAAAASAKIRASIIIFPVILPACFGHLIRNHQEPSCRSTSTARLFQPCCAAKIFGFACCGQNTASVSPFVAGIRHRHFASARDAAGGCRSRVIVELLSSIFDTQTDIRCGQSLDAMRLCSGGAKNHSTKMRPR